MASERFTEDIIREAALFIRGVLGVVISGVVMRVNLEGGEETLRLCGG